MVLRADWFVTDDARTVVAPYTSESGASYLHIGINTDRDVTIRSTLSTAGWTLYGVIYYIAED